MQTIITVFNRLAPNDKARGALARSVDAMQAADESEDHIILMVADAIINGLRFGNWPS